MEYQIDLKDLITNVSEVKNPLVAVAKKTFEDYILRFHQDGKLRNGILNLNGIDESEREEFIKLVGQFDKQLSDMMKQTKT